MEMPGSHDPRELLRIRKNVVVVIHGIGDQRPMSTLTNLVQTLVGTRFFSKSDLITGESELRCLQAEQDEVGSDHSRNQTLYYELYWAHLVVDTKLTAVIEWVREILMRVIGRDDVQRMRLYRLKLIGFAGAVVLPVAVVALSIALAVTQMQQSAFWGRYAILSVILLILLYVLWRTVLDPLVSVVGDAARYLSPRPGNVAARQAIRHAGVDLLTRLHEDPHVDRIIVVGHSLGSVIGYDILTQYWALHHLNIPVPLASLNEITQAGIALCNADPRRISLGAQRSTQQEPSKLRRNNNRASYGVTPTIPGAWDTLDFKVALEAFRAAQDAAFSNTRGNSRRQRGEGEQSHFRPWLVSDFVTVGSPLCYADFLFGGRDRLEQGQAMGGVPTAPPEPLLDRSFRAAVREPSYGISRPQDGQRVFHHAAQFAVTRWTNIYYPGDPFGGPLREQYGIGIVDQELTGGSGEDRYWWRFNPSSHVRYWRTDSGPPLEQAWKTLATIIYGKDWPRPDPHETLPKPRNLGGAGDSAPSPVL